MAGRVGARARARSLSWFPNKMANGEEFFWVEFDGDSSYIDCGSDASLVNIQAAAFTVDAWIRHRLTDTDGYIAIKGNNESDQTEWLMAVAIREASPLLEAVTYPCADYSCAASMSGEQVPSDTWCHVLMSYNFGEDGKLYLAINGDWCTYAAQQLSGEWIGTDTTQHLHIGDSNNWGLGGYMPWAGDISWIRISSGILYPIGVNFAPPDMCAPPAVDGNTIELWAMDEGTGVSTVASLVSPNNDGAMVDCLWRECVE